VAALAGYWMERGRTSFARAVGAGVMAEVLLFALGLSWLALWAGSFKRALLYGLYAFLFAEVIKVLMAAAVAVRVKRTPRVQA